MRFVACLVAFVACSSESGSITSPVIYGEDGRTEWADHPDAVLRRAGESVAMQIPDDAFEDGSWTTSRTLGEHRDLCRDVRFADQIDPGTCTGTLVDSRHVLTALHCTELPTCAQSSWVFGFVMQGASPARELEVVPCDAVVASDAAADLALVRLQRAVSRPTATLAIGSRELGERVALIAHPHGTPLKIDSDGQIESSFREQFFVASLDAFAGASGGGAFTEAGALIGVLRGGAADYELGGDCRRPVVIDEPGRGELFSYVSSSFRSWCVDGIDVACAHVPDERDAGSDAAFDASMESTSASCSSGRASGCAGLLLLLLLRRRQSVRPGTMRTLTRP